MPGGRVKLVAAGGPNRDGRAARVGRNGRSGRRCVAIAAAGVLGALSAAIVPPASAALPRPVSPTWQQLKPAKSPSPRAIPAEAYDPATKQLMLFGGAVNGARGTCCKALSDTWTWSGSTWKQLTPAHHPSARGGATMAYDAATKQLILYGGETYSAVLPRDTWEWTGSTWTELHPAHHPSASGAIGLGYDAATEQLLAFGGQTTAEGGSSKQTWLWTGSDWRQLRPTTSPSARLAPAIAFDVSAGRLVLAGGFAVSAKAKVYSDTWEWTGSTWQQQLPKQNFKGTVAPSVAYDPSLAGVVLFGGGTSLSSTTSVNTTWLFAGGTWTQLHPTKSPPGRTGAGLAFDAAKGQLLLFGGAKTSDSGTMGDSWLLQT